MEVNRERKKNETNIGLSCTKYGMFLLNIVFVVSSVLAILTGISIAATSTFYYEMAYELNTLMTLWLVAGIVFLIVASFGIYTAFEESTALANIYGIAMVLVFILQTAVSIYSFTLMDQTQYIVPAQLRTMMRYYSEKHRLEVDWIQTSFQCCGVDDPTDWQNFDRFTTLSPYFDEWNYGHHTSTKAPQNATDLMPVSCCEQNSNYINLKCEHYHSTGCLEPIHRIVSASILLIGTIGLILSVLQILGFVLGFSYARTVRRKKTQRAIHTWNSDPGNSTSTRQQPDYHPIQ